MALRHHCAEAERWATENARRLAACEQQIEAAAAAALAREKALASQIDDMEAQHRQQEALSLHRETELSRQLTETIRKLKVVERHAMAIELARDENEAGLRDVRSELHHLRGRSAQSDANRLEQARLFFGTAVLTDWACLPRLSVALPSLLFLLATL